MFVAMTQCAVRACGVQGCSSWTLNTLRDSCRQLTVIDLIAACDFAAPFVTLLLHSFGVHLVVLSVHIYPIGIMASAQSIARNCRKVRGLLRSHAESTTHEQQEWRSWKLSQSVWKEHWCISHTSKPLGACALHRLSALRTPKPLNSTKQT
jgi:hypothetical protein